MNGENAGLERFDALWRRFVSARAEEGPAVYAELRRLYDGTGRHFHTFGHISSCLTQLDEIALLLADRDAVEIALWFHDAVYWPGAADNERRSAEMFAAVGSGVSPVACQRVCRLILATRHTGKVQGHDRRFIVDIDLAGFGEPWDEFMAAGDRLRAEFASQPDAEYYSGQVAFLTRLRQRPHLFATHYFRQRYEATAQENLRRLVELRLRQGYRPSP